LYLRKNRDKRKASKSIGVDKKRELGKVELKTEGEGWHIKSTAGELAPGYMGEGRRKRIGT